MGSYSITIKFYGKIPINLTWDSVKEEKGRVNTIQSFQMQIPLLSPKKIICASCKKNTQSLIQLTGVLSGIEVSSCTHKGQEEEAEWQKKQRSIFLLKVQKNCE